VSPRTETAYKADALGKVAPHTNAQGSGVEVNAGVVQLQFAFLSGETSIACAPATGSGEMGKALDEGGLWDSCSTTMHAAWHTTD